MAEWDFPKYRERPTRYNRHEVVLVDAEKYDSGFPQDENAHDFIKWLNDLIEEAPVEFRDSVYIALDSASGYEGSHYATVKVAYFRPETDEELGARIAEYERVKAAKDAYDRAEFHRLQHKFSEHQ
jgi:hypothetical protein